MVVMIAMAKGIDLVLLGGVIAFLGAGDLLSIVWYWDFNSVAGRAFKFALSAGELSLAIVIIASRHGRLLVSLAIGVIVLLVLDAVLSVGQYREIHLLPIVIRLTVAAWITVAVVRNRSRISGVR